MGWLGRPRGTSRADCFGVGIFSTSETDDTNAIGFFTDRRAPDMTAWDVQVGIRPQSSSTQSPTLPSGGGYGQVNDGFGMGSNGNGGNLGRVPANGILSPGTFVNINTRWRLTGTEVNRWFLALDQDFALRCLPSLRRVPAFRCRPQFGDAGWCQLLAEQQSELHELLESWRNVPESLDDFDLIYSGGRIYFLIRPPTSREQDRPSGRSFFQGHARGSNELGSGSIDFHARLVFCTG